MADEADLDNLIADSLGGIETALETEKRDADKSAQKKAGELEKDAVKELRQEPSDGDMSYNEEFFSKLVETFQDPKFQSSMSELMHSSGDAQSSSAEASSASANGPSAGTEDLLKGFMESFEKVVDNDDAFGKQMEALMANMLSKDVLCEPLEQIAKQLGPWLDENRSTLSSAEAARYDNLLRLYRQIASIYRSYPDELPEEAKVEVQRLLQEAQQYGAPPPDVMAAVVPTDAEEGQESFEDFVKQMGLDKGLGQTEQDILKKISEDPEELQKVLSEMTDELKNNQDCKQQ